MGRRLLHNAARAPPIAASFKMDSNESCAVSPSAATSVELVDASNVRAALNFRPSAAQLSSAIATCAHGGGTSGPSIIIVARDGGHNGLQAARKLCPCGRIVEVFSGRRWAADDAIVRDVGWWAARGASGVRVVTSDKLLQQRVRHAARGGGSGRPGGGGDAEPKGPACGLVVEASEVFAGRLNMAGGSSCAVGEAESTADEYLEYVRTQPHPPNTAKTFKRARAGITGRQVARSRKR